MDDTPDDAEALAAIPPGEQTAAFVPLDEEPHHGNVELRSVAGAKLSTVMFLTHFSIGVWFVTLGTFIGANTGPAGTGIFSAGFIGIAYSAGPLGGMVAPFLTGLLADHYFATERIMAVLHVAAAAALGCAVMADTQALFYSAMIAYFICFIPSFALAASLTLHHLKRPERQFPIVRACSTAGWVAAGVVVGWCWPMITGASIEGSAIPMKLGIIGELVTAAFCLLLPHTPPAGKRVALPATGLTGSQTLDLVRQPTFILLIVLAALANIPAQFYYAYANVYFNSWIHLHAPAAKMSLGQVVEVAAMLALPMVLMRISVKSAILWGLTAWCLRFAMLSATASPELPGRRLWLYAAILLHGVAFTFASISLQLAVDRCAGRRQRATAQGMFAVATQGVGSFVGAQLASRAETLWLADGMERATVAGWSTFWMIPSVVAAIVLVLVQVLLPRRGAIPAREEGT